MEQEIKDLIELDLIADKLKLDSDKEIERQVKQNIVDLEKLKLQKEEDINKTLESLEVTHTEEINEEIKQKNIEREKILKETMEILEQNKENIIEFLTFNITGSFNSVK